MNLEQWKLDDYVEKGAEICRLEDKIEVSLNGDGYSFAKLRFQRIDILENSVYRFDMPIINYKAAYKLIFNWIDTEGEIFFRGYLHASDQLTSPKGACALQIELLTYSFEKGSVELCEPTLEFLREYQKNEVILSAVHVDTRKNFRTTCEKNMRDSLNGIERAAKENPDIIVLTEGFYRRRTGLTGLNGYLSIHDEPIKRLQEKAKIHHTYIAFSFNEIAEGKKYNTGVLIDREGEIQGIYRKTHFTMSEWEDGMVPGTELPVFETDFGKVAFAICWDMWFPELIREYMKKGVRVLLNPTAGYPDIQSRARALDNGMYIVSAGVQNRNQTRILNPLGQVIADALDDGYAAAKVDLNEPKLQFWLSVGDAYGEGKNLYPFEKRTDLYTH